MQLQQLGYHRFTTKQRVVRRLLAAGGIPSLFVFSIVAAGQADHFGTGFWCFRVAGLWDYYAYGFVVSGHWIFWHDISAVAAILPAGWILAAAMDLYRRRRLLRAGAAA